MTRVKSWMVARIEPGIPAGEVLASGLRLDRDATVAVASQWFRSGVLRRPRYEPTDELSPIDAAVAPSRGEVFVGTFPGVTIATAAELATDRPSELAARFREPASEVLTFLASVEPDKDLVAFGTWVGERLTRSLSIRGDQKAIEDLGARRAPEMPFWDHQRNVPREAGMNPAACSESFDAANHSRLRTY